MAAKYIRELREAQLGPPWLLGGWSMGGILAAAMATQIANAGDSVEGVALFDSLQPPEELELTEYLLVERFLTDFGAPRDLCRRAAAWASADSPRVALERALPELENGGAGVEQLVALFRLFVRNQQALARHIPKPVPAPLLFVRATQRIFEGWRDPEPWLRGKNSYVEEFNINASHYTLMTEPSVGQLAKRVAAFLTRVEPRGDSDRSEGQA